MVKKLLKHEFIYYFRTFSVLLPIVLVFGVANRVFKIFENGTTINDIAISSSSTVLTLSCIVLLFLPTVAGVVRFYKNLYSAEGYLTFTLPVTNAQHIFVKLLAAVVCQAICLLTVIAAGCIATAGEELVTNWQNFFRAIDEFFSGWGTANAIGYAVEVILLIVVIVVYNMLLYYACITVGQTAKKNRILAAFGAYFVYYIATQVISTAFIIILSALGTIGLLDGVARWLAEGGIRSVHTIFVIVIAIYAALGTAFWVVTQNIMTHKLNLE